MSYSYREFVIALFTHAQIVNVVKYSFLFLLFKSWDYNIRDYNIHRFSALYVQRVIMEAAWDAFRHVDYYTES